MSADRPSLPALSARVAQLLAQRKIAEAIPAAIDALQLAEETLGPEHPEVGLRAAVVGEAFEAAGRYAESATYYERSLVIRRNALGEQDAETATSWNSLGFALHELGEFARAQDCHERALAIR